MNGVDTMPGYGKGYKMGSSKKKAGTAKKSSTKKKKPSKKRSLFLLRKTR